MTVNVTRGGLLVSLSVLGVALYEVRTLLDFVGVSVPIVPYMMAVLIVVALCLIYVVLWGEWKTEPYHGRGR